MDTRILLALAVFAAAPALPQMAAPNSAGVTIGHMHLNVSDMDAQQHFWTEVGGKMVNRDKLVMVQFPGIYVILRKQESSGGSVGSAINHFGFFVKDFQASVAKWKADGFTIVPGNNPAQVFLDGPDGVRVEITDNKSIPGPILMHHIHLFVTDPVAAQKWYVDNFGATPGKRGNFDTANVPGTELTLGKADKLQVPTKGRSVDHMGFEVKNLDAFVAKLQASGIKIDAPIRNSANAAGLRIVYITDPWGVEIELTEGLAPKAQSASR